MYNECTEVQNPQRMRCRMRMHLSASGGKMADSRIAVQCWNDSGSAVEQFQRKSHQITPLYYALDKLHV